MRRLPCLCLFLALVSTTLLADSKNPADYPLRIHIFGHDQTTFYSHRQVDESKGTGRANLFENSIPHAVDFSYDCTEKLRTSFGYETYPAKWKKPGQELVVLLPVFGKANAFVTCNLKTDVKDTAYLMHDGRIASETSAQYKAWMDKHDYDPEHGKDVPTKADPPPAAPPKLVPNPQ